MSKTRHDADENPAHAEPTPTGEEVVLDAAAAGNETAAEDSAPSEAELDPIARLQVERDQLHNQLQRTLADLQNFRKRRVQEMGDARRGATEALVGELLPVLDNFHLATDYDADSGGGAANSIREGLLMVRSLLEGVFERHGVVEIPAAGAPFDPAVHEAVGIDPDPDAEEGVVTKIVQRGYTIDGKVLRPTRVMVGGAPQSATDERDV
jgi:molecular chaperone GrpE